MGVGVGGTAVLVLFGGAAVLIGGANVVVLLVYRGGVCECW